MTMMVWILILIMALLTTMVFNRRFNMTTTACTVPVTTSTTVSKVCDGCEHFRTLLIGPNFDTMARWDGSTLCPACESYQTYWMQRVLNLSF